jgi:hypothetical protein
LLLIKIFEIYEAVRVRVRVRALFMIKTGSSNAVGPIAVVTFPYSFSETKGNVMTHTPGTKIKLHKEKKKKRRKGDFEDCN